jgi:multiple sugar transport system permease protein
LLMAGALVSVLPMIILFVIAQRHFVRGIAMTGIKG